MQVLRMRRRQNQIK